MHTLNQRRLATVAHRCRTAGLAAVATLAALAPRVALAKTPRQALASGKIGLFVHYVFGLTQAAPGKPPLKNPNQFAAALNVNNIAKMASAMGAQYCIITSYHWKMTTLFPSKVWGSAFPGHVCKRDVIGALARALKARHIRLVLYVHPDDRHDFSPRVIKKLVQLGWTSKNLVKPGYKFSGEPHDPKWNKLYYRLLNEIGQRYGTEIAGYWEDDGGASSNGNKVQKIMERYTPGAAIWVNGNISHAPATLVGAENWNLFDHNPKPHLYNTSPNQVGAVIAGSWWATNGAMTYTPAAMYRFLLCMTATKGQHNGGVVYCTSPFSNNQWETGVPQALRTFGSMVKHNAKSIYNTLPSHAYVSGNAATSKPKWGVAVDSMHRGTVYLHVLMPPKGRMLQIDHPADHVTFASARLLHGGKVALHADHAGYKLTLPPGKRWGKVDTVIALKVRN